MEHTYRFGLAETLGQCGFNNTDDNSVFTATVEITTTRAGPSVFSAPTIRTVKSAVDVEIRFPTNVNVSANVTVFGPAVGFTAVTSQAFDTEDNSVNMTVVTQVNYPFVLTLASPGVEDDSGNFDLGTVTTADTCDDDTTNCQQTWTAPVDPVDPVAGAACPTVSTLDGTYTVTFDVGFQPSFTGSREDIPDQVTLTFTLDSDDFCPQVVEVATVSPRLTLHTDNATEDEATALSFGSTVFARVAIEVMSGIQIASTTLTRVVITSACSPCAETDVVPIGDADVIDAIDFVHEAVSTDLPHTFQFTLNGDSVSFDGDALTGTTTVTVTADLTIAYFAAADQATVRTRTIAIQQQQPTAFASGSASSQILSLIHI